MKLDFKKVTILLKKQDDLEGSYLGIKKNYILDRSTYWNSSFLPFFLGFLYYD